MGHTTPTTLLVLLAAVPLATAACAPSASPPPYYVSLPSHTCVNDGQHASQGAGQVLLFDTKAECCKVLTPKERRACLKAEVVSEVYPDFEKGRCVSDTLRPAVVHPACVVTAAGANKFVAARFLKESVRVSDSELCCRRAYGGVGEAAVARCAGRQGTWYYVDGMGCVQDDALADDPVVYATARTVGSLSACTQTYFPQVPVVTCDTFTCTVPWTTRADRGSIHCGATNEDCTKELCCTAPPLSPPPAAPVVTCASGFGYACTPNMNTLKDSTLFLDEKSNPELATCPSGTCTPYDCCDVHKGEIVPPPCEGDFSRTFLENPDEGNYRLVVNCPGGTVPKAAFTLTGGFAFLHESSASGQLSLVGAYDPGPGTGPSSFAHTSATQMLLFVFNRVAGVGVFEVAYTCVTPV